MKAAQSRQKSYHDKIRKNLEFKVGDHMFLRVNPWIRVGRALKSWKHSPHFVGPFQILKRVGLIAYQIELPPLLSNLHDDFRVSQLRKYIINLVNVIELDDVQIKDNLICETWPMQIEDKRVKTSKG